MIGPTRVNNIETSCMHINCPIKIVHLSATSFRKEFRIHNITDLINMLHCFRSV